MIDQAANVTIHRRWSSSLTEFQPGTIVPISSHAPFTGPYKEKESLLYSAFTTLCPHPKSILPTSPSCGFWLCCDWLSHIADKTSQRQAECFIVTRPIFVGWCEWVWCTRLTHYRTVCSVGTCFTATASLVHQLMCTHNEVM